MIIKIRDQNKKFNLWVPTRFIFSDSIVRIFLWVKKKKTSKESDSVTFSVKDDDNLSISLDPKQIRFMLKQLRNMKSNFPGVPLVEVEGKEGEYVKIKL